MNNNFKQLTHVIEILKTHDYVSTTDGHINGTSTRDLLVESYKNNPNVISGNTEFANIMLEYIKKHSNTEFEKRIVNVMEQDTEGSEGYIAYIPKLYYDMVEHEQMMQFIPHPKEFYPISKYEKFKGTVEILLVKDMKVFAITGSGHLLTWYDKSVTIDEYDPYITIEGVVKKLYYGDVPWEVQLSKVKYV